MCYPACFRRSAKKGYLIQRTRKLDLTIGTVDIPQNQFPLSGGNASMGTIYAFVDERNMKMAGGI